MDLGRFYNEAYKQLLKQREENNPFALTGDTSVWATYRRRFYEGSNKEKDFERNIFLNYHRITASISTFYSVIKQRHFLCQFNWN